MEVDFYNLPFYSFLLQPKEKNTPAIFSQKVLLYGNIKEAKKRLAMVNNKIDLIENQYDEDNIRSCANTLRNLLEFILKYYCIYKAYSLPNEEAYGYNMLGNLKKHLKEKGDDLVIEQEVINTANEYSHDSGIKLEKERLALLRDKIAEILYQIEKSCIGK